MNKVLIFITLICLTITHVYCHDIVFDKMHHYKKWQQKHKRAYLNTHEQIYRQNIFFENLQKVQDHAKNPHATYKIGLNHFSDVSEEEYQQRVLHSAYAYEGFQSRNLEATDYFDGKSNLRGTAAIPPSKDWRKSGALNPIKNQGECGSCWTFSVAGTLEAFNYIKTGKLKSFSEQQILDCAGDAGFKTYGCVGGFQVEGFKYAVKHGIVDSQQYRYVGFPGKCKTPQPTRGFYPKKYKRIEQTADALKAAIAIAPVSATVNANAWQHYENGVFNGCEQITFSQLNHAVIAVGYDEKGNWIIRNSYGPAWGQDGYITLAPGNTCGILLDNIMVTE